MTTTDSEQLTLVKDCLCHSSSSGPRWLRLPAEDGYGRGYQTDAFVPMACDECDRPWVQWVCAKVAW